MAFSFGAGQSAQPSFGAKPAGGLFGSSSLAPSQGTQAPSTFSFGGQQNQGAQQSQGGLFGQKPAFGGASQPQGGLFGNTQSQPQQGGLFGNTQSQPQQGSSLFGNTQSQPQQGSLFGNNNQQQQGGLFGSSQPQQGSLFGNTQPQQQGGLFGNTQPQQQGGLFGNTQTQPQGGLFGSAAPAQKPLFGSSVAAPAAANPLATSPLAASAPAPGAAPAPDARLGAPLNMQLERIRASWDTSNLSTCQFQVYLYNRAPDSQSLQQLCVRRSDAVGLMHDNLWNKALQENPEPERLYPVLAVGFGELQMRANAQLTEAARQRAKLAELSKKLEALQHKHELSNSVRAQAAVQMQARIRQRLLGLVKYCYLMIVALRNHGISTEEDQLFGVLQQCEAQLNGADLGMSGFVRLSARLNELWAQIGVERARREVLRSQGRAGVDAEWAVVDDAALQEITTILGAQQQGLQHLSNTLSTDGRILDTVCDGLTDVPLVGVKGR